MCLALATSALANNSATCCDFTTLTTTHLCFFCWDCTSSSSMTDHNFCMFRIAVSTLYLSHATSQTHTMDFHHTWQGTTYCCFWLNTLILRLNIWQLRKKFFSGGFPCETTIWLSRSMLIIKFHYFGFVNVQLNLKHTRTFLHFPPLRCNWYSGNWSCALTLSNRMP